MAFATSGNTGSAVRWWRTDAQLRAEARLVARALPGRIEQIVCFAPPQHLYGYLFGRTLPALLDVPVKAAWQDPLEPPRWRDGLHTLFVCVPSSWLVLRSLRRRLAELPGAVALHGTGPAPDTARRLLGGLPDGALRAVEVFGSTETGAAAVRDLDAAPAGEVPWRLLGDVEADSAAGDRLRVRGPRLARREGEPAPLSEWAMDDVVRWVSERAFVRLGRASRLIKVNGVRCDLDVVEAVLNRSFPGAESVCLPTDDAVRGEYYDVFLTGDPQPARAVSAAVTRALPGCPPPRSVHRVDRIERSATGKPLATPLHAVLARQCAPHRRHPHRPDGERA
ncbi:acyl-CoA synthetase [Streptomyces sp. TS71-3]|uniref:acyl-CoA synthetase n=1 Tax=Streptomyces sp. TS71-3 TaxID=2733862 RepID=UPI001B2EC246|nr:acyl-CoA synthetase [Streptomyces sp. TS71-3]GHJ42339.1 hypothetical protein Sm713_79480 [Streptomyces sp. TS71-3]